MIDRSKAAKLGAETLGIIERGGYDNARGEQVPLAEKVASCVAGTVLLRPNEWPAIHRRAGETASAAATGRRPAVEVTGETTLAAARRLVGGGTSVLALNFASAKNPGGGFLGGSRAQEESLARSSALYPSLCAQQAYYDANRAGPRAVYTDHAIYSPRVPVFRDDDGAVLDEPYNVSFLTMPAVNVGAMRQHGRLDRDAVARTMARRVGHVLALSAERGYRTLVLGAWGCGVFRNDPEMIAGFFADALDADLGPCFERVTFAVFDPGPGQDTLAAFRRRLGEPGNQTIDGR